MAIDYYTDGERANAAVLNRPLLQLADLIALATGAVIIPKEDHGWTDDDLGTMVTKGTGENVYVASNANSAAEAEVVGFISKINTVDNYEVTKDGPFMFVDTAAADLLCGTTGGLVEKQVWWLLDSPIGAQIYSLDPPTLGGKVRLPAFVALSDTAVSFFGYAGSELSDSFSKHIEIDYSDLSGSIYTWTHNFETESVLPSSFDVNKEWFLPSVKNVPDGGALLGNRIEIDFGSMVEEDFPVNITLFAVGANVLVNLDNSTLPVPNIIPNAGNSTDAAPINHSHAQEIKYRDENGIIKSTYGCTYNFDDWEGINILTQSGAGICKPIPYKKALSNVFTGFEVIGWEGRRPAHNTIYAPVGLNWIKDRDEAESSAVFDYIRKASQWRSASTAAAIDNRDNFRYENGNSFDLGTLGAINSLNESYISWNWHYPCAKAWHKNGTSERQVSTPWGMVTSIPLTTPDTNMDDDAIVIELYNPLTGNGCLLFVGTAQNRILNISGGIEPEFMIMKNLIDTEDGRCYHRYLDEGNSPEDYQLRICTTDVEQDVDSAFNDTRPTLSSISLGANGALNGVNDLCVLYYFSPIPGLQAFGDYEGNDTTPTVTNSILPSASGCKNGMCFIKSRDGSIGNWNCYDFIRDADNALYWNLTAAETTATAGVVSFGTVSGIDISGDYANDINNTGAGYIYGHFGKEMVPQGNFDVYLTEAEDSASNSNGTAHVLIEYEGVLDASDLTLYASRESTANWVIGSFIQIDTLASGVKLFKGTVDLSGRPAGSSMRWRLATTEGTLTEHNIYKLDFGWS